jgi:L-rhamnose-H+ transport protein
MIYYKESKKVLFETSFIIILLAGVMNGSFAIPMKFISGLVGERIWQYHSIGGLIILPWIFLAFISPKAIHHYALIPPSIWCLIISSGLIFGVGQMCFSYAIERAGVALSFATNLGVGVVIGSLFVVFYKHLFFTYHGLLVVVAVLLIVLGLIMYFFSSRGRAKTSSGNITFLSAWLLAACAGTASGLQNIAFIVPITNEQSLFTNENTFWVWPPFLLAASLPMVIGFGSKIKQRYQGAHFIKQAFQAKQLLLIIMMDLLFAGSLALYSLGVDGLLHTQLIVAWPMFMVTIILTTQAWGGLFDKHHHDKKSRTYKRLSITFLVIAIVLLSAGVQ